MTINRNISKNQNRAETENEFKQRFGQVMKYLPREGGVKRRRPIIERLTKNQANHLPDNFVDSSRHVPEIREVLKRLPPGTSRNEERDIIRACLRRLHQNHRKRMKHPLMTDKLIKQILDPRRNQKRQTKTPKTPTHAPGPHDLNHFFNNITPDGWDQLERGLKANTTHAPGQQDLERLINNIPPEDLDQLLEFMSENTSWIPDLSRR